MTTPETLIERALRREDSPWPGNAPGSLEAEVLDAAAFHGVSALLAASSAVEGWPVHVRSSLASSRRHEAIEEAVRREELVRLLDHLARHDVRPLLLKGAGIAYTRYPHAWLRPRADTDLLVASSERSRADGVLRALGYEPGTNFSGELVTHQFQYKRRIPFGFGDTVDLHWKIANPHVFADVFTFEELDADAVSVAALGANARTLSTPHALVLACVHRVAHHDNSDRLIWLYDVHLLTSALTVPEAARTAQIASEKRLRAVSADGLERARTRLGTTIPDPLAGLEATAQDEPAAAFLQGGRTKFEILISDLVTLRGWRRKLKLVAEHLVPPADYMRQTYRLAHPLLLPFAYVERVVLGTGKWFRRSR